MNLTSDFAQHLGQTRVICVGMAALDEIWCVERRLDGASQKIRASSYTTAGGGMAATSAFAIAKLGAKASFWGRAGNDAAGAAMRGELSDAGVDISQFRCFDGGRSSVSAVIVDESGERQIVNFRGAFPEDTAWLPLEQVAGAAAVLADPRWVAGTVAAFGAARARGIPTVLDADIAEADVFETLLPLTDHAIFSEPALRQFAGDDLDAALAKVAAFGCRVAAVTRGQDGIAWLESNLRHDMAACPVDVVDTTGAGDVFHGAYALALGAGWPTNDAMRFSTAVAALKCTRIGGRAGIPTLDDMITFLRTSE
ncbi:MAG: sugar kinase [Rhizobiales bacterium 32-66-8]|nr:MAG: sugar kinase [Rhizobiales bacterium 32-66-8]